MKRMTEEFVIFWNPALDRNNPERIVFISPAGADDILPDDQHQEATALAQPLEPGEAIIYHDTGTRTNGMRRFAPRIVRINERLTAYPDG